MKPFVVEICANSVESALAAQQGGADRVELCDNLYEGGTTPSMGAIHLAREKLCIGLNVLLRPRGGDFLYSDDEMEIMIHDIGWMKSQGVDGVVLGALSAEGSVDVSRTRHLVEAATPMSVTFHRAIDMVRDPVQALEDVIACGVDRVLTSGRAPTAMEGAEQIRSWVIQGGDRIRIMAGSGVKDTNVAELVTRTGVKEVHLSGQHSIPSAMTWRNESIRMGGVKGIPEYERRVTNPETVRRVIEQLQSLS